MSIRNLIVASLMAFVLPIAPSAHADLSVCNRTLNVANIAIAQAAQGRLVSRGWWVVTPNRCADVVTGPLTSRYVYVHASDVEGRALFKGGTDLCVGTGEFEVDARADCFAEGLVRTKFQEIDTGTAGNWTLFLQEPAR